MSEYPNQPNPPASADTEKARCFVIMPISDPSDYEQGHFLRVYTNLLRPAIEATGFEPIFAGDVARSDVIQADILNNLLNAEMALCDISSRNPNVFFELGIRQAYGKPVVIVNDGKHEPVFDTSILRYTHYSKDLRVDHVAEESEKIQKAIRETYDDPCLNSIVNVLSVGRAAQLKADLNIAAESMQMIISRLDGIRDQMLEHKISHIEKQLGFDLGSPQHRDAVRQLRTSLGSSRYEQLRSSVRGLKVALSTSLGAGGSPDALPGGVGIPIGWLARLLGLDDGGDEHGTGAETR